MNNQTTLSLGGRAHYVAPCIEVIEVETEGVIAGSGVPAPPNIGDGGTAWSSTNSQSRSRYNAASSSEIEEMISDIFTVEQ